MSMFGLKSAEVASLIRPVAGDDLDRGAIELAFARAAWSGLAEPGDGDAGALVAAIGPVDALSAVIAKEQVGTLAARSGIEPARLAAALDRWRPKVSSSSTMLALRIAGRYAVRLRSPEDSTWPVQLDDLGTHAPLALWTRGADEAFAALGESVALVGARAATGYGEAVTMELSAGLVDRGFAIVSGAAYGIDGMAHRTALASHGVTMAFLAGGPDRFYPSGHESLLNRIVEHGVVISELPCGVPPTRWRFLQRNRLIAASSLATVVVEAGARSGSLNTAHHAAELGRPLGAVPGSVNSAASTGCHRLMHDGLAVCVTNPDDVLALFGAAAPAPAGERERYDPASTRALDALSARVSRQVAEVARRSGLSERDAAAALGRLELEGAVARLIDGWRRA